MSFERYMELRAIAEVKRTILQTIANQFMELAKFGVGLSDPMSYVPTFVTGGGLDWPVEHLNTRSAVQALDDCERTYKTTEISNLPTSAQLVDAINEYHDALFAALAAYDDLGDAKQFVVATLRRPFLSTTAVPTVGNADPLETLSDLFVGKPNA